MKEDKSLPLLTANFLARFELYFQESAYAMPQLLPKPATAKAQSLLAFLVLRRSQKHSREHLMAMYWGDRPEQRARRSLATALWQIRRCFPSKSVIQADINTVQFSFAGQLQLDTEAFARAATRQNVQSLQVAVTLYQGALLDGFYDDWIITERDRLQSLFLELLARLMHLQEAAGAYKVALETAVRLLDNDPLREEAYQVVMRAYYFMGQRNAALKQYALCRQIIARELGVEPMPATSRLYDDICNDRLVIPSATDSMPSSLSVARSEVRIESGYNPLEATAVPPLIGRDNALSHLAAQWQQTLTGQRGMLIIQGEAGVGKTRLAESFAEQLQQQGYRVLWGRCYEFERLLPYQPLLECVRSALPRLAAPEWRAIPDWSLAELARLLPELLEQRPDLSASPLSEPESGQTPLFTALARFLAGLASHAPYLIIVDDLQWAGESTLQLLHFLARQLLAQPILIAGTARPASGGHFQTFQQSLEQENLAAAFNLPRLTAKDTETLVGELSGRGVGIAPLAHRLFQETEGNPFFLIELCRSLFENNMLELVSGTWRGDFERISSESLPLPGRIATAIQVRVQRLPPETRALLGVISVLGCEFNFEPLNALWGKGDEATLEALDQLLRARLIQEDSSGQDRDFSFTHQKIQEVVYAELPRRRRQYLHGQAGQVLQTLYADQAKVAAAELAHHFEQGQQLNKDLRPPAVHFLYLAGKQAADRFANADAAKYFTRALSLTPAADFTQRYELLAARQLVYGLQGKRELQAEDIAALKAIAWHGTMAMSQQAEALVHEARFNIATSNYPAAIAAAREAVSLAKADLSAEGQLALAEGYLIWGQALMRQGDSLEAQSKLYQVLTLTQARRWPRLEADSLNNMGLTYYYLGDYGRARAHYEKARQIFQEIGSQRGLSAALNNLGAVTNRLGDNSAAAAYYRQALDIHRQTGNRRGECLVSGNLGVIAAAQGSFTQARSFYTQSQAAAREIGQRLYEGNAWLNLGNVSLYLGVYQEAKANYESALSLYRQIGSRVGEGWAHTYMSLLAHRQGQSELAITYGLVAKQIAQEIGDRLIEGYAYTHLGHAYLELNQLPEAEMGYQEAVSIRRELGEPDLVMESLSGLVRVYMVHDNLVQAMVWVEEIMKHLGARALEGVDEPLRVYLTCYQALAACQDPHAQAVLQDANALLQTQAARIEDEDLRRSFLGNVPAHREIAIALSGN